MDDFVGFPIGCIKWFYLYKLSSSNTLRREYNSQLKLFDLKELSQFMINELTYPSIFLITASASSHDTHIQCHDGIKYEYHALKRHNAGNCSNES